ncbi:MAG: hypothetical protein NG737_07010 [Omnitrophica bacterium]|nr:hypothetical protein [Candidatus Omnitrophota bacterium]
MKEVRRLIVHIPPYQRKYINGGIAEPSRKNAGKKAKFAADEIFSFCRKRKFFPSFLSLDEFCLSILKLVLKIF